ncbi:MAG: RluA family pseudouridine synthase [Candidatus Omnitrophica bacterium]|nr:RluA family pseudouridine synthase [Candidatus Omnitrophota bacterium]
MASLDQVVPALREPTRIDVFLARALVGKFSRQEVKRSLDEGRILLNARPAKPRLLVKEGDRITGEMISQKHSPLLAESIPLSVVYEDECLLVIDKPAGMVVHPGAGNKKGTLVHALLGRDSALSTAGGAERPGIVHRLDKDTSGLMVVAKDNVSHRFLQAQFASRTFSKTYTALVKGRVEFEEGRISKSIGRDPKVRRKRAVSSDASAKEAETRYRVLERFSHATLLEVKILTGRTHQIRVHLACLGYPVVGDVLYGSGKPGSSVRLGLHASKIGFTHPKTGESVEFESKLPDDFEALIRGQRLVN